MIKILKNVSASGILINDTGVHIDAGETYTIPHTDYLLWAASLNYQSFVIAGDIVVNNGSIDLNPTDGVRYLQYADRAVIQSNGADVTQVTTAMDFTGNVTVTDSGNGKATVFVSGERSPILREVTAVVYPFGFINTESNLLFEYDIVNDEIIFLKEEII